MIKKIKKKRHLNAAQQQHNTIKKWGGENIHGLLVPILLSNSLPSVLFSQNKKCLTTWVIFSI